MPDVDYVISSGADTTTHDEFTISTTPIDHDFCGVLSYTATYDSADVDTDDKPFAYDGTTRTYTIDTVDEDLKETTVDFVVTAELASWPADTTTSEAAIATGSVTYESGCKNPTITVTTAPTNPASDDYSSNAVSATIPAFTVVPDYCTVTYTCTTVNELDGQGSNLGCSDFGGITDGEIDGTVSLTATPADYTSGSKEPGQYEFTVKGTVDGSEDPTTATTTVTFTLTDPCGD